MNVLELVRSKKKREIALIKAQKQLCYRGVEYTKTINSKPIY